MPKTRLILRPIDVDRDHVTLMPEARMLIPDRLAILEQLNEQRLHLIPTTRHRFVVSGDTYPQHCRTASESRIVSRQYASIEEIPARHNMTISDDEPRPFILDKESGCMTDKRIAIVRVDSERTL